MVDPAHLIAVSHWIGEQPSTSNYIHKTAGLLSDLPHLTTELFYSGLENIVILGIGWIWAKRRFAKEHARLDKEHGFTHEEDKPS